MQGLHRILGVELTHEVLLAMVQSCSYHSQCAYMPCIVTQVWCMQGGAPAWQYAQANGANGHYSNGMSQSMLPSDLFLAQQASQVSHKSHQAKPAFSNSGLSHEPATWNARYDM